MGYIRGKLLTLPFRLIAFGDIHHKQHSRVSLSGALHRVGRQRVHAPIALHAAVRALAAERGFHRADIFGIAAQRQVTARSRILWK